MSQPLSVDSSLMVDIYREKCNEQSHENILLRAAVNQLQQKVEEHERTIALQQSELDKLSAVVHKSE